MNKKNEKNNNSHNCNNCDCENKNSKLREDELEKQSGLDNQDDLSTNEEFDEEDE